MCSLSDSLILKNAINTQFKVVDGDNADLFNVSINNTASNTLIAGSIFNDHIVNSGDYVSIDAGAGDDFIANVGNYSTVNAGDGNDFISLGASAVGNLIRYTGGFDTLIGYNSDNTIQIETGSDADFSFNGNDFVIKIGNEFFTVVNASPEQISIIDKYGNLISTDSVSVAIDNSESYKTVNGTSNADSIYNTGNYVSITGGTGDDAIINYGDNVTIDAGVGNDVINLYGSQQLVQYASGDGNDSVYGFDSNSTLHITSGELGNVTYSGLNVILPVGSDSITVVNSVFKPITVRKADGSIEMIEVKPPREIPSDAFEYNGHYYYVFNKQFATWEDTEQFAESLGGHLAVITDRAENDAIYNYMSSTIYRAAYFGLTDAGHEGIWTWITGESFSYTNWHSGEPNNGNGSYPNENYVQFASTDRSNSWNDFYFPLISQIEHPFIVEWEGAPDAENIVNATDNTLLFGGNGADTLGMEFLSLHPTTLRSIAVNSMTQSTSEAAAAMSSCIKSATVMTLF